MKRKNKKQLKVIRGIGIAISVLFIIGFILLLCFRVPIWLDNIKKYGDIHIDPVTHEYVFDSANYSKWVCILIFGGLYCLAVIAFNIWAIFDYTHHHDPSGWTIFRGYVLQGIIPGIVEMVLYFKQPKETSNDSNDYEYSSQTSYSGRYGGSNYNRVPKKSSSSYDEWYDDYSTSRKRLSSTNSRRKSGTTWGDTGEYRRRGNTVYSSRGEYRKHSGTIYGPDGDIYHVSGNEIHTSSGDIYRKHGNEIYGPNGDVHRKYDGRNYGSKKDHVADMLSSFDDD